MSPYRSVQMRANEKLGFQCMYKEVKPYVKYTTSDSKLCIFSDKCPRQKLMIRVE